MDAPASDELVRIVRIEDLDVIVCRVHLSTNDCIVVSELSDSLDLDGLCIIPTSSVRYFDRVFERSDFYRAALTAWPNVNPHVPLLDELACDMVIDLRHLGGKAETVAIHMELDEPDVAYVGTIRDVTATALLLDRISARGKRISEPLGIELKSITKIEVATRYLIAVGQATRVLGTKQ